MGVLDRMRERMADLEEQERQKQKKEQAESRKRYRPEPDNCALPRCRWEAGGFAAVSWGLFVGLSFINNAGFGISGAIEFTPPQEARRQFDVNFFLTWRWQWPCCL